MAVTDLGRALKDIYSIAINRTHVYHSSSQTALSLLSSLANLIQSMEGPDLSKKKAYRIAISYILFDSAVERGCCTALASLTIAFKPNDTRIIIQFLSKAIDPGNEIAEAFDLSPAAIAVLEHAETIMPWLWRASQHGIQTEFIVVMVL
jgi:hypothetical protein